MAAPPAIPSRSPLRGLSCASTPAQSPMGTPEARRTALPSALRGARLSSDSANSFAWSTPSTSASISDLSSMASAQVSAKSDFAPSPYGAGRMRSDSLPFDLEPPDGDEEVVWDAQHPTLRGHFEDTDAETGEGAAKRWSQIASHLSTFPLPHAGGDDDEAASSDEEQVAAPDVDYGPGPVRESELSPRSSADRPPSFSWLDLPAVIAGPSTSPTPPASRPASIGGGAASLLRASMKASASLPPLPIPAKSPQLSRQPSLVPPPIRPALRSPTSRTSNPVPPSPRLADTPRRARAESLGSASSPRTPVAPDWAAIMLKTPTSAGGGRSPLTPAKIVAAVVDSPQSIAFTETSTLVPPAIDRRSSYGSEISFGSSPTPQNDRSSWLSGTLAAPMTVARTPDMTTPTRSPGSTAGSIGGRKSRPSSHSRPRSSVRRSSMARGLSASALQQLAEIDTPNTTPSLLLDASNAPAVPSPGLGLDFGGGDRRASRRLSVNRAVVSRTPSPISKRGSVGLAPPAVPHKPTQRLSAILRKDLPRRPQPKLGRRVLQSQFNSSFFSGHCRTWDIVVEIPDSPPPQPKRKQFGDNLVPPTPEPVKTPRSGKQQLSPGPPTGSSATPSPHSAPLNPNGGSLFEQYSRAAEKMRVDADDEAPLGSRFGPQKLTADALAKTHAPSSRPSGPGSSLPAHILAPFMAGASQLSYAPSQFGVAQSHMFVPPNAYARSHMQPGAARSDMSGTLGRQASSGRSHLPLPPMPVPMPRPGGSVISTASRQQQQPPRAPASSMSTSAHRHKPSLTVDTARARAPSSTAPRPRTASAPAPRSVLSTTTPVDAPPLPPTRRPQQPEPTTQLARKPSQPQPIVAPAQTPKSGGSVFGKLFGRSNTGTPKTPTQKSRGKAAAQPDNSTRGRAFDVVFN